jgi:hypothetical protein
MLNGDWQDTEYKEPGAILSGNDIIVEFPLRVNGEIAMNL